MTTVVNWGDVEPERREAGFIGATWRDVGTAAGSRRIGVQLIELAPGEIPTPPHVHHDDEETFFVLDGDGLSWQDGATYAIRAGDAVTHRRSGAAHTLRAGGDGMRILAFGERSRSWGATLPRSKVRFSRPAWVETGGGDHPWAREAALGPPEFADPAERPPAIVNADDADVHFGGGLRVLTPFGVTDDTGLNLMTVAEGATAAPRHRHSTEEELYVVLDGRGTLYLDDDEHDLRAGDVAAFPAGRSPAHGVRGGPGGLRFLAYGQRRTDDIVHYPTSGRVLIRGIGVIAKLEPLPYPAEPELF